MSTSRWENSIVTTSQRRSRASVHGQTCFDIWCRGLTLNRTPESRGILALSPKDSWLPTTDDAAIYDLRHSAYDMWAEGQFFYYRARFPSELWSLSWKVVPEMSLFGESSPDITIASVFTASLSNTNGSAATALSTIITILASMDYYDQFPNFAETAHNVSTTYLQPVLFPQSFRGFATVLVVTIVHLLLVLFITVSFVRNTRLSTLGEHWQSIAQVVSPSTESLLAKASCATDKEVRRDLKAEHREHEMANLQELAEGDGRVGLVARKSRRQGSHDMSLE